MKFMGSQSLVIDEANMPKPDTINWNNFDIPRFSQFLRFVISIFLIVLTIFICSSVISIVTLVVTTRYNCASYDSSLTIRDVIDTQNSLTKFCFCSVNSEFGHQITDFNTLCSNIGNEVLKSNIAQAGASLLSSATNMILTMLISFISTHLLKPANKVK